MLWLSHHFNLSLFLKDLVERVGRGFQLPFFLQLLIPFVLTLMSMGLQGNSDEGIHRIVGIERDLRQSPSSILLLKQIPYSK